MASPTSPQASREELQALIGLSQKKASAIFEVAIAHGESLSWPTAQELAQAIRDAGRTAIGKAPNEAISSADVDSLVKVFDSARVEKGQLHVGLPSAPTASSAPPPSAPAVRVPPASGDPALPAVGVGHYGLQPSNFDELRRVADAVYRSGLAPENLKTPQAVFVVIATGMELGMKAMSAMRQIYVVNNLPRLRGEACLALIRSSRLCRYLRPSYEGEGDKLEAVVRSMRGDQPGELETRFSVKDAKDAGLWQSKEVWKKFPKRMLMWRAVGHHASDYYSDVTMGMMLVEVAEDLPPSLSGVNGSSPPPAAGPGADPLLTIDV